MRFTEHELTVAMTGVAKQVAAARAGGRGKGRKVDPDDVWEQHRAWAGVKDTVPDPPSSYYHRSVFGCFFRDRHGIASLSEVGVDNITFETDYPHTDSTWPDTKEIASELLADLDDDAVRKIVRGNAIRMLHLDLDA